ncbi:TPA: peptidoglycan-binding protein [Escherichia coli]|nr:peptidoglycan-binding protein [Escherichia coli]
MNPPKSPAFEHTLAFVLALEGGYVNDPSDRGGETNLGIADRRDGVADGLTDVNGDGKPDTPIKSLTPAQAGEIYYRDYWLAAQCQALPDPVALFLFDSAVQHGVKKAVQLLQEALCVTADGVAGRVTLRAANDADDEWLLNRCFLRRSRYYAGIVKANSAQGKYLTGWFNRLDALADACREVV